MRTPERIVITGLGAVSAAGVGAAALFEAALAGRSGIRPWPDGQGRWIAAAVPDDAIGDSGMPRLPASVDRHVGLAGVAVREALDAAGLPSLAGADSEATGVYWGTGVGSASTLENTYAAIHHGQRPRPLTILLAMQNAAVAQLALEHGLRGPQLSISQACASAAAAIGEAMLALRLGRARRIVAGGSEAPLAPGQLQAWEGLRVLAKADPAAPETSCRPFDASRSGLVLGEGAAAVVLELESVALARNAPILAELCGYGNAGDASHYARPDPNGQRRAMALAIADASLAPGDIGYINAHATATVVGDETEAAAIHGYFGDSADAPAVSSTKGIHGHTLGAAGALEFIIATKALAQGLLPPNAHLTQPNVSGIDLIRSEPRRRQIEAALSNTFAFGGSNIALAIRRYRPRDSSPL